MDGAPQSQGVTDASKDIASSYSTSKEDVVAYFIFGIALAAIVAIVPILIISKTKESKIASLEEQYKQDVTDQLSALKKEQKDQVLMAKQIDALSAALDSRIKNSQLLEAFGKNTLKKTKWTALTLDDGSLSLSLTADNFDDVAKAVSAYRNMDSVKSVKLNSATNNEASGKIDFAVSVSVDMSQYTVKAKPMTAAPTQQTTGAGDLESSTPDQMTSESLTPIL